MSLESMRAELHEITRARDSVWIICECTTHGDVAEALTDAYESLCEAACTMRKRVAAEESERRIALAGRGGQSND